MVAQEHFSTLRGKGDKIKLSKVVWHVIKSWDKVSGWGLSSSPSLSLFIFFNRQRVFCLAQSWVWHSVLRNQESFAKRRACSSSVWRIFDSAYCEHGSAIFTSHSHMNDLMSTLSTFEMWLHHHTENRVIETVDTGNVQKAVRCDLFAVQRWLLYSQVREGFHSMADVEKFHLYPHLNRILRTGIAERR
jgi:hypothetical protein